MDKDEMIKEIYETLSRVSQTARTFEEVAYRLYTENCRIVGEDEIVIKKSEYENLSKTYAAINSEAYYCGLSVGEKEAKQETRDILQELYMYFTEDYLCGLRNCNKDHKSAGLVARLAKAYGIELEG